MSFRRRCTFSFVVSLVFAKLRKPVPLKEDEVQEETGQNLKGDRFAVLAAESDQVLIRRV